MSSIAVKRLAALTLFCVASSAMGTNVAAKAESAAEVVARTYKDFSWEALTSQPEFFGRDLAHQDKLTLQRYFTPALAELLAADAACQVRVQGICNLDFSLLFYSQDPRVTDLDVRPRSKGEVEVGFTDPVNGEQTTILFRLVQAAGTWRIDDILYGTNDRVSLKTVLSRRMPR